MLKDYLLEEIWCNPMSEEMKHKFSFLFSSTKSLEGWPMETNHHSLVKMQLFRGREYPAAI